MLLPFVLRNAFNYIRCCSKRRVIFQRRESIFRKDGKCLKTSSITKVPKEGKISIGGKQFQKQNVVTEDESFFPNLISRKTLHFRRGVLYFVADDPFYFIKISFLFFIFERV